MAGHIPLSTFFNVKTYVPIEHLPIGVCCWKLIPPSETELLVAFGRRPVTPTPPVMFMLKGVFWVWRLDGNDENAWGPTPFVFICITLGAAAVVLDCGLLKRAIMESFDITPVFSFSPVDGLLLPNAVPNCSKSLLFDINCPLLLLPFVLPILDVTGARTKSSKSLSFVDLVDSEIKLGSFIVSV